MRHFFTFAVNNGGTLTLSQTEHDGPVEVVSTNAPGEIVRISAGDMVMLINLYRHVKRYDLQNDFINPGGKNSE